MCSSDLTMLNEIGKDTQGIASAGISGLKGLIENYETVLLSYIFLAVGQTISGISQNVYLQEKLNPLQLNKLYLKIEVLNQVLTGIVVFVSGMLIKRGLQVTTIYLGYSLPVIILVLGIMLMTKLYKRNPEA